MEFLNKAATIIDPADDKVHVLAVTTSSQESDMSSAATAFPKWETGNFVTFIAEQNTWINFGDTSSGSVDETTTGSGAGTEGWFLAAGVPQVFLIREARKYLRYKGAAAGYLRWYVSSCNPTEYHA